MRAGMPAARHSATNELALPMQKAWPAWSTSLARFRPWAR